MEVSRHDDIGIDPQIFVIYAEIQTVRDNSASRFVYEYRQPFNHAEGYIVQSLYAHWWGPSVGIRRGHTCLIC